MSVNVCIFFRVEILENIFSLLFLRHEDFQEETSSDSGADDDDGEQDPRVHKSEIISKLINDAGYKNLEGTDMTHSMTSFQQIGDVSSSLRTMLVIEAHVTGSPPLEHSNVFPDEAVCQLSWKAHDMSLNSSTSPLQVMDMSSSLSKISVESHVNISSQQTDMEKCSSPISNAFNKLSSSMTQFVTTSPSASAEHNSVTNTYRTAKVATMDSAGSALSSSNMTSDFSKLQTCGDVHQYTKVQERRKSARSSHSENASIRSRASSMTAKGTQQGFICNQYLIRDLLHCLKECLVETSAAFYSSLTMDTVDLRKVEVVSSVEPELLQQRMNR
jgi:hypothetical protein